MTTGMSDYSRATLANVQTNSLHLSQHTFMIKSGLKVPTPAIPMPDFAVPYAAPAPKYNV